MGTSAPLAMWITKHLRNADPVRTLLLLTVVSVPFSVKLYTRSLDLEVIFPAEPLIGSTALLLVLRSVAKRNWTVWRGMLIQPITLAVLLYAAVLVISALCTTMPVVSAKAAVVRLAYVLVFYFGMLRAPISGRWGSTTLLLYHAALLVPIAFYSFAGQVEGGLDRASSGYVSYPFYIDHTIYSAALTFGFFVLSCKAMEHFRIGDRTGRAVLAASAALVLAAAIFFSFARAAWLSTILAVMIGLVAWAWSRWPRATAIGLVVSVVFGLFVLLPRAGSVTGARPVNASAYRSGAWETVLSFTNITTDPSNVERLNRWSCAWRMFLDRPWTGTGPGTYQFKFLTYQRPHEMSSLSAPDLAWVRHMEAYMAGDRSVVVRPKALELQYSGGTAHSEYLLALSETGVAGGLAFMGIIIAVCAIGARCIRSVGDRGLLWSGAAALLGVLAYAVHGLFNNYLDDCKIALPFWGALAVLAKLDLLRKGLVAR